MVRNIVLCLTLYITV